MCIRDRRNIPLAVQERQGAFSLQIWTDYTDVIGVALQTPSGEKVGPIREVMGTQRFRVGKTELLLYYGEPSPYTVSYTHLDVYKRQDLRTGLRRSGNATSGNTRILCG